MKPKPVVVTTICSECDRDWDAHGDNPTASDCIRLLKAEIAKRPTWTQPVVYPYVFQTWPYRQYEISYGMQSSQSINTTAINGCQTTTTNTPSALNVTCTVAA